MTRLSSEEMIKRDNAKTEAYEEVHDTLVDNGVENFTHLWTGDYSNVLEIYLRNKEDYRKALDIMGFDAPYEAQSVFGVRSENLVVIQFDRF